MTLLIRDVHILGGARDYPDSTDVFVSGETISAIGNFPNKKAAVVLDGHGAHLSPGFIDVNTDSDHYLTLFDHPGQEDFLRQGVTTIFGGMCGSSLAPLMYGDLESLGKWADPNRVNVNWHTMNEFLDTLAGHPLSVNFGTLAGHDTIRRGILGDAERDLTKNELRVFARTLDAALQEGAFGASTGLAYIHERKTPRSELKIVADLAKKFRGVYATHLRDTTKGIETSTKETIELAKEAGVKTLISHFVPVLGSEGEYENALKAIDALPRELDFRFDLYPSANTLRPLYTFLPLWAQTGTTAAMVQNLKDEWFASKIRKDLRPLSEEHFILGEAAGNDFLVGKSLTEIKQIYGLKDGRDALIRLMAAVNLRGGAIYREVATDISRKALRSSRSFVSSNAPSFDDAAYPGKRFKSDRSTKTFTDFLDLAENGHLVPLEEAIKKLTQEPAAFFNLPRRGMIREGYFADLTCFKGNEIKFTVVNGRLAMENGEFKKSFAGKALRHKPLRN